MSRRNPGAQVARDIIDSAKDVKSEPPRPLIRELPPADPFPTDALGDVLAPPARAIHDRVQAPHAMCGQSILATATLAVQGRADVQLPTGQLRPLSDYYVSVGATGERKTAVDAEANWPVRKREAKLREEYDRELQDYINTRAAWEKAREFAMRKGKGDRVAIKSALDALGPAPDAPLKPLLTCTEPTFEGLTKLYPIGWPSLGIYSDEGGQFFGGHGMAEDAKLRTSTGLSRLWDGHPIDRVRGGDGVMVLHGRRLSMHLMAQPEVAALLLADGQLADQGLLSRILVTAPESAIGNRLWRAPSAESDTAMKKYGAQLLDIFEAPFNLAAGKRNELSPRALPLSNDARRLYIAFYNHIEKRLGPGGELEPIRGLANKLPEHAARIAAVLTLTRDLEAGEVASREMESGIALAQHYAAEALRLFGASQVSPELRKAWKLLEWLRAHRRNDVVSLVDIYQFGPSTIRDKKTANSTVAILEAHGFLIRIEGGAEIDGKWRRDVWRLVNESEN